MALRVWLPLNGTLENKGISDITVTNNGATVDNNGKIGKCYKNTGTTYCTAPIDIKVNSPFSLCFWYRIDTWVSWGTAITLNTSGKEDYIGMCPHSNGTQIGTNWYEIRNGTSTAIFDSYHSNTITVGTWNHIAITFDGSTKIKTYINGILVSDGTVRTTPLTNFNQLTLFKRSTTSTYGKNSLNDVRVYDNCLSQKEVKEISQGLVLHYKLDGWSGGVGENLALDTANKINTSTAATKTVTLDYGLQSNFSLIRGKKITISADIILENAVSTATSGSKRVGFEPAIKYSDNTTQYMGYWIGLDSTPKTSSGRYSTTVTVQNKDFQSIAQNGTYIQGLTSGTATIKNIKVELGDEATPWSPAPQDLGIDTAKITDSSGYGNDGTVTGTLSTESDSDRYEISTHYPGSSYTDTGSGTFNWFDFSQCTLSAWIKPTASVSGWSGSIGVQHNQNAGHKGFTITDYANNFRVVTVNGSYTTIDSGKPLTVGEWHHCAAVLNGTNLKMYYDGVMVKESTISWGSAAIATDMRFATGVDFPGSDETFIGNYSDVRMYCTALSAEDILDLYHTSANIDNEKRLHSFEFVEDDCNRVDEQGLVHSGLLSSDSDLIKLLYDKKLHIEPDGSVWAHIYHHNRPDLGSFSSTNDFANSVKIDDNRWFNATEIVNSFSSEWEFLIIYNFTQDGTVYKERWIQTKNPETAVFGDVDAADITRVTGNGYRTGTWGGLYKKNSSAYWVMNNGTNGNWWGATGSFSIYQGGIPGYGGSITTTGCNDLYIRIDRFSSTPTKASIGRGSVYTFNDFIEK